MLTKLVLSHCITRVLLRSRALGTPRLTSFAHCSTEAQIGVWTSCVDSVCANGRSVKVEFCVLISRTYRAGLELGMKLKDHVRL